MRCKWIVLVALVSFSSAAWAKGSKVPAAAAKPPPSQAEKDALPAQARALLVSRMRTHKVDMNELLHAVLMLDRDQTAKLADNIAGETKLGRPTGAADEINSLVPARFFELQERLQQDARALAEAARAKDDAKLGKSFAKVAETCVNCHASYLLPGAGNGQ